VEWAPVLEVSDASGLNKVITPLEFHKCTDEDFDKFQKPRLTDKDLVETYRKKKSLYCLNRFDNFGDAIDYDLAAASSG
jgi:hypothetical protein